MFRVTQEQIDQFNEDGFLVVEDLLDSATVEKTRACYERLFRGEFETEAKRDRFRIGTRFMRVSSFRVIPDTTIRPQRDEKRGQSTALFRGVNDGRNQRCTQPNTRWLYGG